MMADAKSLLHLDLYTVWRETLEGANFGGMARKASLAE